MTNAKIQITVKVDDIPREVKEKLNSVYNSMDYNLRKFKKCLDDLSKDDIISAALTLKDIRDENIYADSVMSDCYNIMSGYINYKSKLVEPTEDYQEATEKPILDPQPLKED